MSTFWKEAMGGMRPVEVRIPCADVVLIGELAIPEGARGVVVFAHGSGSSRHSPRNQFVAEVIRRSGNGTLLMDLLTAEEELEDEVTACLRFDLALLAGRLREAKLWLVEQHSVQGLGIGYFGSSTGGGAALVAAAEDGDQIDAVVSRGGRADLAGDALPLVQAPTLLIVGGYDHTVLRLNDKALTMLRCEKELRIIPGATHLFEQPGALETVADIAAKWFCKHLHLHNEGVER